MKKIILILLFPFFVFQILHAEDLRIAMGNSSGSSMNVYVRIENKGTAEGGAKYDKASRSIANTSPGTKISVMNVDFGNGRYGDYSRIMLEYSCPDAGKDAFFDVFLEDSSTPIASVPVQRTAENEYMEGTSTFTTNLIGKHRVYIAWRNHSAILRTFGANETQSFVSVGVVKTGSPLKYDFASADFGNISGVHNVKMVWKNQNASVYAVYLDKKGGGTSIVRPENKSYKLEVVDKSIQLISEKEVTATIYSVTGVEVYRSGLYSNSFIVPLNPGIYILRINYKNTDMRSIEKIIIK